MIRPARIACSSRVALSSAICASAVIQVRLHDRAHRGNDAPGQDVGVRAALVHEAGDEGPVT